MLQVHPSKAGNLHITPTPALNIHETFAVIGILHQKGIKNIFTQFRISIR